MTIRLPAPIIINVEGNRVRTGIEAPKLISVIREALQAEIGRKNRLAASSECIPVKFRAAGKGTWHARKPEKSL